MMISINIRNITDSKLFFFVILMGIITNVGHAQNFSELDKITAPVRSDADFFGYTVSISGNYAIIGAYQEDEDVTEGNTLSSAGSAYIFENDGADNWSLVQKIVAPDRSNGDRFGRTVAINGNYAIIGAYTEDEDENGLNTLSGAGSAYIFERDGSGTWNFDQKIVNSDRFGNDRFGQAVGIHGDYIAVGAHFEDEDKDGLNTLNSAGSVYVFERDGSGVWNEVQKLVASDRNGNDQFGSVLSIYDTYLVVGAPNEDEDELGNNNLTDSGSAYIFERDGSGNWNEVQKIVSSDRGDNDNFASAVSISGNDLIVGALNEDEDENGLNTLISAGSAYIFQRDGGGNWNEVQKIVSSDRESPDFFGSSVTILGNYAVIGAHYEQEDENGLNALSESGSVYIFNRNGSGVWSQIQKVVASDRESDANYGFATSMSGDNILVGAYNNNTDSNSANPLSNSGAAYIIKSDVTLSQDELIINNNASILIYPNPSNGIINFNVDPNYYEQNIEIELLDLNGRIISKRTINHNEYLNIESLSDGFYLLRLSIDDKIFLKKIIKK